MLCLLLAWRLEAGIVDSFAQYSNLANIKAGWAEEVLTKNVGPGMSGRYTLFSTTSYFPGFMGVLKLARLVLSPLEARHLARH